MQKSSPILNEKALLALGITKTKVDVYHVGRHQYGNQDHAIAEAHRAKAKNAPPKK